MPMKAIIKNLHLSGEYMTLTIDGDEKKFRIKDISPTLDKASEAERNTFEVLLPDMVSTGLCLTKI